MQDHQKNVTLSGIPSVLSFITMWVKAWRRVSSPKPARTLQPLRDLLASWVGIFAGGSFFFCGGCHVFGGKNSHANLQCHGDAIVFLFFRN